MTAAAQYDVGPTPLGRLGQPGDLLGALAFLISDESAFITGQTLLVNGGRLSHRATSRRSPKWGDAARTPASQTRPLPAKSEIATGR